VSVTCLSPPSLCATILHASHERSSWSSPFFSSTILQNFTCISRVLSEESNFQCHRKKCSKYHFISFFLKFKSIWLAQITFLLSAAFAMAILDLTSRVPLVSLLSCYENNLTFHILQYIFIWRCLYWGWLPEIHITLLFPHIHFHSLAAFSFINLLIVNVVEWRELGSHRIRKRIFHFILFYSVLFCFIYFILFYSILFCSILFYSVLFYLFYFILLNYDSCLNLILKCGLRVSSSWSPLLLVSDPLVGTSTHLVAPVSVCFCWLRWTHMLWM
jgi:hypothetical protein